MSNEKELGKHAFYNALHAKWCGTEIYRTTDGQEVEVSWVEEPMEGYMPGTQDYGPADDWEWVRKGREWEPMPPPVWVKALRRFLRSSAPGGLRRFLCERMNWHAAVFFQYTYRDADGMMHNACPCCGQDADVMTCAEYNRWRNLTTPDA